MEMETSLIKTDTSPVQDIFNAEKMTEEEPTNKNAITESLGNDDNLPDVQTENVITDCNIEVLPKEISSTVVINRHTQSLKNLMIYDSGSDSENSDSELQTVDSSVETNSKCENAWRKNPDNSSDTDSESDSDSDSVSSNSETVDADIDHSEEDEGDFSIRDKCSSNKKEAVEKKNPYLLDLDEYLPALPDLSKLEINADESEFMNIGNISAIISELVTIEALPNTPAFDIDSMLFISNENAKKPIGPIFDVLGPVTSPIYCVRFNSENEISELGLKSGTNVYAIPRNTNFTKFVFVRDLMRVKGSDASWSNDQEVPSDIAEFSDDEKEREARRVKKANKTNIKKNPDGSQKRLRSGNNSGTLQNERRNETRNCNSHQSSPGLSAAPVYFDPTVPPPVFGQNPVTFYGFGQPANFNNAPYGMPSGYPHQNWPMYSHWSGNQIYPQRGNLNQPPGPEANNP